MWRARTAAHQISRAAAQARGHSHLQMARGHPAPAPTANQRKTQPSRLAKLDDALQQIAQRSWLNPAQTAEREAVLGRFQKAMAPTLLNMRLEPIGSHVTGLADASSDLDAVLLPAAAGRAKVNRGVQRRLLIRALVALRRTPGLTASAVLIHARVPVVRAVDAATGTTVDVTACQRGGVRNSTWVRSALDRNASKSAETVAFLARLLLKQHRLSDNATGGLGGYATACSVLWALRFFEAQFPNSLPPGVHGSGPAAGLMRWLALLGRVLPVQPGFLYFEPSRPRALGGHQVFLPTTLARRNAPKELHVMDPCGESGDITANCHRYGEIQHLCESALSMLEQCLGDSVDARDVSSALDAIWGVRSPL